MEISRLPNTLAACFVALVDRMENALIVGVPSPSLSTLRKYAAALGKRLEVRLV